MKLKEKVALVTGATSGIGKAIADRFAAEGAHVVVNYRPAKGNAEKAASQIASYGQRGLAHEANVSERAAIEAMVRATVAEFGRLDIVINNAGIEIERPFLEISDEEWHKVIGLNLYGPFVLSQAGARQMVSQGGGGRIINISSVHEDIPFPNYTPYCAAKGGIRMLMRNLAMELAPHRISVNNIAPGAIATPINQQVLDDPKKMAQALEEIPWGRFGRPEEVASVAAFLASDEADYVTGSTYYIDGGLTQQVTRY
ncbi:MAG: SDR family oxidoreductase [Verrucomicrobiota bacterium]